MLMEAAKILIMIIQVFNSSKSKLIYFYIFGYGKSFLKQFSVKYKQNEMVWENQYEQSSQKVRYKFVTLIFTSIMLKILYEI